MTILLFLFGVAVAAGLFFILADILKLPRLSTEKALLSAGRTEKKRMKSLDALFLGWAIKLSHFIRMDEYKRHRMERTLSAAGMDMTPEVYLVYTILKPAAALLAVIPCLLIFPLLSPVVVLLSILLYFKESRKAEEKVAERREKIEGELPRFVATVEQELGASRDVLTILENYKRHAGPDFARELDVLTADMRIINGELENLVFAPRKEFISMAALVVLNIPLLYFLNKDWYATLMTTVPGKAVLAVSAAAIFLSFARVVKLTQPIEYRR